MNDNKCKLKKIDLRFKQLTNLVGYLKNEILKQKRFHSEINSYL